MSELLDRAAALAALRGCPANASHTPTRTTTCCGLILEHATGKPWRAVVRERVIERLHLRQHLAARAGRRSGRTGHRARVRGLSTASSHDVTDIDSSMAGAAGGHALLTTTHDLSRVPAARCLAGRLFRALRDTVSEMRTFVPAVETHRGASRLRARAWNATSCRVGVEMIGHMGTAGGYRALMFHLPAQRIDLAMVINAPGDPHTRAPARPRVPARRHALKTGYRRSPAASEAPASRLGPPGREADTHDSSAPSTRNRDSDSPSSVGWRASHSDVRPGRGPFRRERVGRVFIARRRTRTDHVASRDQNASATAWIGAVSSRWQRSSKERRLRLGVVEAGECLRGSAALPPIAGARSSEKVARLGVTAQRRSISLLLTPGRSSYVGAAAAPRVLSSSRSGMSRPKGRASYRRISAASSYTSMDTLFPIPSGGFICASAGSLARRSASLLNKARVITRPPSRSMSIRCPRRRIPAGGAPVNPAAEPRPTWRPPSRSTWDRRP